MDQQVLDKIVHYAAADLGTVLMAKFDTLRTEYLCQAEELAQFAQSVEHETRKGRALGRDVVPHVDEVSTIKERRTYFCCGITGHIKSDYRSRDRKNHVGRRGRGGEDLFLAINDVRTKIEISPPNRKRKDLVPADDGAKNEQDKWISDSGSSRHLVNDESLLEDARDCSHECNMVDGET